MARQGLLTDAKVKSLREPKLHADGGGLYLQITPAGSRSWIYRYYMNGARVPRTMGLGAYPATSLKQARTTHLEAVKLRDEGRDPIDARKTERQIASNALTVQQACEAYLVAQRARFRTERHVKQIKQRLRDFVYPVIGDMAISDIKAAEARLVLAPIWQRIPKTAGRVRQYCENVIDYAVHEGLRSEELANPFGVRKLQFALPFGIHKTKNHAAMPFEQVPAFMTELRAQNTVKSLALQFVILNAVRVGDIVGGGKVSSTPALWSHIDFDNRVWEIPDTKMSREHRVPLSDSALAVLEQVKQFKDASSDYIFPGKVRGSCINDATLRMLLKEMDHAVTVHGFRSSFKTFASEITNFDRGVVEAALAHAPDELTRAYHRGDFRSKRATLMTAWADFLDGRVADQGANVVALRA